MTMDLKWTESRYGTKWLVIAGWLELRASYDDIQGRGYKASVNGRLLQRQFQTMEEAQQAALRVARKWVGKAATELAEEGGP